MQTALAYFIVCCAAVVGVRRYAPGFALRVRALLRGLAARLGWRIAERPRDNVVMTISPSALKRSARKKVDRG